MINNRALSIVLILIASACIDRLDFEIELPQGIPITIDGNISNQPGPYRVKISTGSDIKSEVQTRQPLSVKRITLMDNEGNKEELTETDKGTYQTSATGMQGKVGGVYKIKVELLDGKIYESLPDTLLPPGTIQSLYHEFNLVRNSEGVGAYGFDIKVNSIGSAKEGGHYRWKMKGTFKAITQPERIPVLPPNTRSQCYPFLVNNSQRCNYLPPCTGLQNTSLPRDMAEFVRVGPCECCTCWYEVYNRLPILNNHLLPTSTNSYPNVDMGRIPLNEWIFMFKIYIEARQESISDAAFRFFASIKDQQEATGNIFLPITGKIPNNFIQLEGEPAPVNGLFYASGLDIKMMQIIRDDVPDQNLIPEIMFDEGVGWLSCLDLFPNATTTKPDFWVD
jgi:hypothetical protein